MRPQPHDSALTPRSLEELLFKLGDCAPRLAEILPHLCVPDFWAQHDGSIYFNPPPGVDDEHQVYVLVPLHTLNSIDVSEL